MHDHEDPSPDDLERFGDVTVRCPSCGAEVYDQSSVCQSCRQPLGSTARHAPMPVWAMVTAIVCILLVLLWFL